MANITRKINVSVLIIFRDAPDLFPDRSVPDDTMKHAHFWLILVRWHTATVVHVERPWDRRLNHEDNVALHKDHALKCHPGFVFAGSRFTNPDRSLPAADR